MGRLFEKFGPKDWMEYYVSLNKEIPADKVRLDLTDEQKKAYTEDLNSLLEDRKKCPAVRYEVEYKDFE